MNAKHQLDEIDINILKALQRQGRIKQNTLAEMTGLSVPAIGERMKKLEGTGVIIGYHAIIDPRHIGVDVTAFISVIIDSSKHYQTFLDHVKGIDEIVECHAITGEGTHLLKVRTGNTAALEKLLSKIQSWQGVTRTMTRVVLSSPKETVNIPISFNRQGYKLSKKERL